MFIVMMGYAGAAVDGGFAIKVPAVLFAKTFDVKYTNGSTSLRKRVGDREFCF